MAPKVTRLLHVLQILLLCVSFTFFSSEGKSFIVKNNCDDPVWPVILPNDGAALLTTTSFALRSGASITVAAVPTSWSGRVWGRTHCSVKWSTGNFSCRTGNCGSSTVECAVGVNTTPPATVAAFTLNGSTDGLDFYGVSLDKGFNIPLTVEARGGSKGNCWVAGQIRDLNARCPTKLRVMYDNQIVGCKSTRPAFGDLPPSSCVAPASYRITFCATSPSLTSLNSQDEERVKRAKHFLEVGITRAEIIILVFFILLIMLVSLLIWFCLRHAFNSSGFNVGNFTCNCLPVNILPGWLGPRLAG